MTEADASAIRAFGQNGASRRSIASASGCRAGIRRTSPASRESASATSAAVFRRRSATVLRRVARAVLVDVALADDLKAHPRVRAIEGQLPDALASSRGSLDVVMGSRCSSTSPTRGGC